jgi:hypothetical protein
LTSPTAIERYSYLSGQPGIKVVWDRFTITGEGCNQDYSVILKVTPLCYDQRFPEETNWLQYVKSDLDNTKKTNYVTIVSEAIYDTQVDATVNVEGQIKGTEKTSSFTAFVVILPAKRPIKNKINIKARVPSFKLESISPSGLLVLAF